VSLLTDLDGFYTEHRRCGDLDGGVDGDIVWMACDCGASIARRVDDDERRAAGSPRPPRPPPARCASR
jgi:hypothetical protein